MMMMLLALDTDGTVLDCKTGTDPFVLLQNITIMRLLHEPRKFVLTDIDGNLIHEL